MRRGSASSSSAFPAWALSGLLLASSAPAVFGTAVSDCPSLRWAEPVVLGEATLAESCRVAIPRHLASGQEAEGLLFGIPLDLNRASAEALEALPGIGPQRAAAVRAAREQARFRRVSDLVLVPGIGPVTLDRVRPFVQVAEEAPRSRGKRAL